MKKHILTFLVAIAAITAKAQGNLQFNQVITEVVSNTSSSTTCISGSVVYYERVFTVPAGKVWKVEYIYATGANSVAVLPGGSLATICTGAERIFLNTQSGNVTATTPIWLKAGTKISFYQAGANSFMFSAIEFNVN